MISYQLLGPIEVYDDGRPVRLGGRRQRAVLAALLLEAGKAVSVRRLTEVVWTGCPPETARSQIQICVSALRRANCPIVTKDY
jgi:DNA-binding SARP family transcriptional activator